jgi:hypothetical protein
MRTIFNKIRHCKIVLTYETDTRIDFKMLRINWLILTAHIHHKVK